MEEIKDTKQQKEKNRSMHSEFSTGLTGVPIHSKNTESNSVHEFFLAISNTNRAFRDVVLQGVEKVPLNTLGIKYESNRHIPFACFC